MRKDNEVIDTERMVLMNSRVTAAALILTMALCFTSVAVAVPYTGVVSIDSVEAHAGQGVAVPIRLSNSNISIAGIVVPVKIDTTKLKLDSVSFVGSLIRPDMIGVQHLDAPHQTIEISYIPGYTGNPLQLVTASSGVIATMYIHILASTSAGYIPLDSVYREISYGGEYHSFMRVEITDSIGSPASTMLPGFIRGAINVLAPTGVNDNGGPGLPHEFTLEQNYPNPFNPSTVISFSLPTASHVTMEVFNILGQNVVTLLNENMSAGNHQVNFDASAYPSGIYFYRWTHRAGSETRKMILVK